MFNWIDMKTQLLTRKVLHGCPRRLRPPALELCRQQSSLGKIGKEEPWALEIISVHGSSIYVHLHASGVGHLGIPDHSLIYAVRKFMLPKTNPGVREIRDYKHFDAELFVEDLSRMPWNAIQQFNNPNKCMEILFY